MLADFLIYPVNTAPMNATRAREYLAKLHPSSLKVSFQELVIEIFGQESLVGDFPLVFGTAFCRGKLFSPGLIQDHSSLKGNYVILSDGNGKLNIEIDALRQFHIFSNPLSGLLTSSFLAACHFLDSLTVNRMAFYEKMFRGYNIAPDTVFKEILHVHEEAQLNLDFYSLSDNRYRYKKHRYANRNEAIEVQVRVLDEYMEELKPLAGAMGVDLGISSGYDSRLLLALMTKHQFDHYQLHTHGIKGVSLHGFEQSITRQIASSIGKEIRVVQVEPFNRLMNGQLDRAIEQNFNYFQGRNSHNMGAFTQTYALPYKKEVMGKNRFSLNGLGGEIFRNYYYLPKQGINLRLFAQNHLFYRFSNWLVNEKQFDQVLEFVKQKIEKRLGLPLHERTNLETLRRYYSEIRMPDGDGCNHNAHNKYFHFLTPFMEPGLYDAALGLTDWIGTGGDFEGELINRVSPVLASLPTHYGATATNPGWNTKLQRLIKVSMGQKIQRKRFDYIASRMTADNQSGRFLEHMKKESTYFREAWNNLTQSFNEINWNNIHLEFPCMVNSAMLSVTFYEFRQKINNPGVQSSVHP